MFGSYVENYDGLFKFAIEVYSEDGDYDVLNETNYNYLYSALNSCSIDLVITVNTIMTNGSTVSKSYNVNVTV